LGVYDGKGPSPKSYDYIEDYYAKKEIKGVNTNYKHKIQSIPHFSQNLKDTITDRIAVRAKLKIERITFYRRGKSATSWYSLDLHRFVSESGLYTRKTEYKVIYVKENDPSLSDGKYRGMNYFRAKELGLPFHHRKKTVVVYRGDPDRKDTAKHEISEAEKMKGGEPYKKAHRKALEDEKRL